MTIVSFYAGVPQREAIAGLNYFLTSPLNSAFLIAPARCGMTWLLRRIKQMHGFGDCAADVVFTDGNQHHQDCVHAELCAALGYHYTADRCQRTKSVMRSRRLPDRGLRRFG